MGEPLSTTLGAAALLAPLFTACKHLHHGYKLTRAFGEDFVLIQTRIDVQHARVQQFAKKQVRSLKGYERVNIGDENDPVVSVIIRCLATVKAQLETCNALMEQYHKKRNYTLISAFRFRLRFIFYMPTLIAQSQTTMTLLQRLGPILSRQMQIRLRQVQP